MRYPDTTQVLVRLKGRREICGRWCELVGTYKKECEGWDDLPTLVTPVMNLWHVFHNGKLVAHRLSGPAVQLNDGSKGNYYIHGKWIPERSFWSHPLVKEYAISQAIEKLLTDTETNQS